MKHLILGTAGHVDHGKTTLVKALTGIDTDRLPEEKARGMTIELGFAHLTLPSGITLGIVDMPGHERFIKHMAAGAGGVDIALLVIAADEGIMRQTEEHMEILELLGIKEAVVAITKSDLVEQEWLLMVHEEIADRLKSTILSGSPIVEVSAQTGKGMEELVRLLDEAAAKAGGRAGEPASRMYIDRAFTITGHGTVVTGTLLGGPICEGDKLELLPGMRQVRVKQVEVHDVKVNRAEKGQRVALNISGLDRDEVERGMALASPGWLAPTFLMDVEVRAVKGAKPIIHGERLRLHIGTTEVICRARVPKGQSSHCSYMQLETEEPIFPARGDRFVLRAYSPQSTIAGGTVLLSQAPRRKMGNVSESGQIAGMSCEGSSPLPYIVRAASRIGTGSDRAIFPVDEGLLAKIAYMPRQELKKKIAEGTDIVAMCGEEPQECYYLDKESYDRALEEASALLAGFHAAHPLKRGMPKEELRQKLAPATDRKQADALFTSFCSRGRTVCSSDAIWLSGHEVRLDGSKAQIASAIEERFERELLTPPDPKDVLSSHGKAGEAIMEYLLDTGILVKASSDVTFHRKAVEAALKAAATFEGAFTAALLRDALGTSRKYAIAMLEWMDSKEYTQRSGDTRTLKPQYRNLS